MLEPRRKRRPNHDGGGTKTAAYSLPRDVADWVARTAERKGMTQTLIVTIALRKAMQRDDADIEGRAA